MMGLTSVRIPETEGRPVFGTAADVTHCTRVARRCRCGTLAKVLTAGECIRGRNGAFSSGRWHARVAALGALQA